jgi:hypothetical protein
LPSGTCLAERGCRNDHEEVAMNPIRAICRSAAILTGLAATLVSAVAVAPAALATVNPPGPGAHPRHPIPFPPHAQAAVTGGTPGWQIALIALAAAVLATSVAVLINRARAVRRHPTTTPA